MSCLPLVIYLHSFLCSFPRIFEKDTLKVPMGRTKTHVIMSSSDEPKMTTLPPLRRGAAESGVLKPRRNSHGLTRWGPVHFQNPLTKDHPPSNGPPQVGTGTLTFQIPPASSPSPLPAYETITSGVQSLVEALSEDRPPRPSGIGELMNLTEEGELSSEDDSGTVTPTSLPTKLSPLLQRRTVSTATPTSNLLTAIDRPASAVAEATDGLAGGSATPPISNGSPVQRSSTGTPPSGMYPSWLTSSRQPTRQSLFSPKSPPLNSAIGTCLSPPGEDSSEQQAIKLLPVIPDTRTSSSPTSSSNDMHTTDTHEEVALVSPSETCLELANEDPSDNQSCNSSATSDQDDDEDMTCAVPSSKPPVERHKSMPSAAAAELLSPPLSPHATELTVTSEPDLNTIFESVCVPEKSGSRRSSRDSHLPPDRMPTDNHSEAGLDDVDAHQMTNGTVVVSEKAHNAPETRVDEEVKSLELCEIWDYADDKDPLDATERTLLLPSAGTTRSTHPVIHSHSGMADNSLCSSSQCCTLS